MKIVIIDYGAGNTKSVEFAFKRLGIEAVLSSDANDIIAADGVVFPGVGHAQHAMQQLKNKKLDLLIPTLKQPVLGICLGMQLMCAFTEEGNTEGLGIFDIEVNKFQNDVKIPQIGWNQLKITENELFKGLKTNEYFYFVHSYYAPIDEYMIGSTCYGIEYSAALQKNNFYACQFHPEKSGVNGEIILKNFIELCELYQL